MKLRQIRSATDELLNMPRMVNNALAMAFVALLIAGTAVLLVIAKGI